MSLITDIICAQCPSVHHTSHNINSDLWHFLLERSGVYIHIHIHTCMPITWSCFVRINQMRIMYLVFFDQAAVATGSSFDKSKT